MRGSIPTSGYRVSVIERRATLADGVLDLTSIGVHLAVRDLFDGLDR